MKKSFKKLSLTRETLLPLNPGLLKNVDGGFGETVKCDSDTCSCAYSARHPTCDC